MMNLHLVPTLKKKCGIAEFAKGLNSYLNMEINDSVIISPDVILLEHEYAYDGDCWEQIEVLRPKTFIYMHSVNLTNPNNQITHRKINELCEGVFVSTEIMKSKLAQVITIPIYVIQHYSEPITDSPDETKAENIFTIGMHGFAVPRTCLIRGIMELGYNLDMHLHIVSTINDVTLKHFQISKSYLDRCRSVCRRQGFEDRVTFDFNYYKDKSDIIKALNKKCDMILLVQADGGDTYNASGTARVALASGRPVVVPSYPQFDGLPEGVVYRMKDNYRDSIREVIEDPQKVINSIDIRKVIEYTEETSPANTAAKIKEIMVI